MRSLPHNFNLREISIWNMFNFCAQWRGDFQFFSWWIREKFSFHNSVNTVNILCSYSRLNKFWGGWSVSTQFLVTWFCTLPSLSERLQRFTRELGNVQVAHVMLDIFLLSTLFSCEWVKSVSSTSCSLFVSASCIV